MATANTNTNAVSSTAVNSESSTEEWRPVSGYEGLYEVSDLGRVRSLDRTVIQRHPRNPDPKHSMPITYKGQVLKQGTDRLGRKQVSLSMGGQIKPRRVHQLVAEAFLSHVTDGTLRTVVDHKDNNPSNNRSSNLQLITQRENTSKDKNRKKGNRTGVSYCKSNITNPWLAQAKVNGKSVYIGKYATEDEAGKAYDLFIAQIPVPGVKS